MNRRNFLRYAGAFGSCAVLMLCTIVPAAGAEEALTERQGTRIACVGDSITFGARLENRERDAYPAQLQGLLGDGYEVVNLGVGGCTLIREGIPTVWRQLERIQKAEPDIIVISLGTNDTCGGQRNCWSHKDAFAGDYRDLIDILRALPSQPRIFICAPSPMVLDTPGLSPQREADLKERKPRLQELITLIKGVAKEKNVAFIDLNTPLRERPDLFAQEDGVHPNKEGYRAIAELVYEALRRHLS